MNQSAMYVLYALIGAGAAAIAMILPHTGAAARRVRLGGTILGAAALAGIIVHMARWLGPWHEGRTFFLIFSALAIIAAVRVVTHPRPVYSALYFVLVVLAVTGLCILGAAEFLGVALVIVYAGAILVTYVFVIMLAQQAGLAEYDTKAREPIAAVAMGFILAAAATQSMVMRDPIASNIPHGRHVYQLASSDVPPAPVTNVSEGNVRALGVTLMTTYVVAVELAGVLLLVAVVGAIAIAQKRIDPTDLTSLELSQRQVDQDLHRAGREAEPF